MKETIPTGKNPAVVAGDRRRRLGLPLRRLPGLADPPRVTRRALFIAAVATLVSAGLAGAAPPSVAFKLKVGRGAGVPAVEATAVWVPNTKDGTVSRVDPRTRKVVKTIKLGAPPRFTGYLDCRRLGRRQRLARPRHRGRDRPDRPQGEPARRADPRRLPARRAGGRRRLRLGVPLPRPVRHAPRPDDRREEGLHGPGRGRHRDRLRRRRGLAADRESLDPDQARPGDRRGAGEGSASPRARRRSTGSSTPGGSPRAEARSGSSTRTGTGSPAWTSRRRRSSRRSRSRSRSRSASPGTAAPPGWPARARSSASTRRRTSAAGTVTLSPRSQPVFTQVAAGPAGLWATDYDEGMLYRLRVP